MVPMCARISLARLTMLQLGELSYTSTIIEEIGEKTGMASLTSFDVSRKQVTRHSNDAEIGISC